MSEFGGAIALHQTVSLEYVPTEISMPQFPNKNTRSSLSTQGKYHNLSDRIKGNHSPTLLQAVSVSISKSIFMSVSVFMFTLNSGCVCIYIYVYSLSFYFLTLLKARSLESRGPCQGGSSVAVFGLGAVGLAVIQGRPHPASNARRCYGSYTAKQCNMMSHKLP